MAESIQQLTSISPSQPGNLQNVWSKTSGQLYHKLSPYTNDSGLIAWGQEPFVYNFPDKTNTFLNGKYDSFSFPIGSAATDVIRMSKFIVSGKGVLFLAKNLLLQTGNSFNETRLYSPTEVLVSAARPGLLGLTNRVTRHLDLSGGGLVGILGSLVGIGSENSNQPSGTVDGSSLNGARREVNRTSILSDGEHISTEYRGLSRAGTANIGLANFKSKWGVSTPTSFMGSLFANTIPSTQDGILVKGCESAYGTMLKNTSMRLWSFLGNNNILPIHSLFFAGGDGIRKNGEYPRFGFLSLTDPMRNRIIIRGKLVAGAAGGHAKNTVGLDKIKNIGDVGYTIQRTSKPGKAGLRYEESVGSDVPNSSEYTNSDIMLQYGLYVDPKEEYASKKIDKKSVDAQNSLLIDVLNSLNYRGSDNKIYNTNIYNDDSRLLSTGKSTDNGYNRLFNVKSKDNNGRHINPWLYNTGVLKDYSDTGTRITDRQLRAGNWNSLKLPTTAQVDSINTLTVLSADILDKKNLVAWNALQLQGWGNKQWNAYDDDQIAFYFYDIVNQNYIPFRATITGISEGGGAEWEALSFIGRADKVYSYSGFTRTLSFKFSVNISSIAELAPTWQRINYLSTLIKPSNYTTDNVAANSDTNSTKQITNRFMIPPMIMLNVGDMYREQPVVITQVGISIPEDASWETLNEDNTSETDVDGNKIWSYLSKNIQAKGRKFGQLPRSVNINMTMNLLEKEQPVVGGANFGHAPRTSIFKTDDWNANTPDNSNITNFNKNLVVDVNTKQKISTPPTAPDNNTIDWSSVSKGGSDGGYN